MASIGGRALAQVEASPGDLDAARKALFIEALRAMAKKDWATCRVRALGVWTQKPHAQVAGLLGICETNLGMDVEAAGHIAYYRKNDDSSSPARTKDVGQAWERVKTRIAIIELETSPGDAEIVVAGKPGGTAPQTIDLAAGGTTIEVRKDGFKSRVEQVVAELGTSKKKRVELESVTGGGRS